MSANLHGCCYWSWSEGLAKRAAANGHAVDLPDQAVAA